jgi:hypothetical protein
VPVSPILSRCILFRPPVMLFLIGILMVPLPTAPLLVVRRREYWRSQEFYYCSRWGVGEWVSRFIEMKSIALFPARVELVGPA